MFEPTTEGREREDKDRASGGRGKIPESYSENHRRAPNGGKWNAPEGDLGNFYIFSKGTFNHRRCKLQLTIYQDTLIGDLAIVFGKK